MSEWKCYPNQIHFKKSQGADELIKKLMEIQAEIDRLKAERRWIPVSERLPEEEGQYLIIDRDGDMQVADRVISPYRSAWSFQADLWVSSQVTHWMPLPEPPEGEA